VTLLQRVSTPSTHFATLLSHSRSFCGTGGQLISKEQVEVVILLKKITYFDKNVENKLFPLTSSPYHHHQQKRGGRSGFSQTRVSRSGSRFEENAECCSGFFETFLWTKFWMPL